MMDSLRWGHSILRPTGAVILFSILEDSLNELDENMDRIKEGMKQASENSKRASESAKVLKNVKIPDDVKGSIKDLKRQMDSVKDSVESVKIN